jgi:putative transposase
MPLRSPSRTRLRVFRDAETARAFKLVGIDERANGQLSAYNIGALVRASPADLRAANRRYAILAPYLTGKPVRNATTPERTIRDWLARWRVAERIDGCGFVGLLPRLSNSGNRLRKLPEATLALMDEFVDANYERLKQKGKSRAGDG